MSVMWKPHAIDIYQDWIRLINKEAIFKLTEYEKHFITGIIMQLEFGHNLSESQATILERIYAQKTK